jgi:MoxR-like ATPase
MDTMLLFRKHTPLSEDGLPWLSGAEEHAWTARRNTSGKGVISAILVRSLLCTLEGNVLEAYRNPSADLVRLVVRSHSAPSTAAGCWLDWSTQRCGVPHGELNKVTYHLGVLAIVQSLAAYEQAQDFWQAYASLLASFRQYGHSAEIKETLCRACDELYYFLRYGTADVSPANSRLEQLQIGTSRPLPDGPEFIPMDITPLVDPEALGILLGGEITGKEERPTIPNGSRTASGFVGWQLEALSRALALGDNILLAGPTGTGKTFALHQVVQGQQAFLVSIEGKEGLTDLDFIGAILPQENGSRRWVDGPLLRAMRQAQLEPVLLFLDEVNRIPRAHLNILLGLMNPKRGQACRQMGLDTPGDGLFYMVETPLTSEIVVCPTVNLRIVAAGNFGRLYQVYDLDPAVRRRFDTVIEFDYLEYQDELALLHREVPRMTDSAGQALVKLAQESRRLMSNGELPGCIDTASLLNWARKCQGRSARTLEELMQAARLTWADTVCGRDHTGRVNQGSFSALEDYLTSLAIL